MAGALVRGSPSQSDHTCLPVFVDHEKSVHDSVLKHSGPRRRRPRTVVVVRSRPQAGRSGVDRIELLGLKAPELKTCRRTRSAWTGAPLGR
jgi:hypothetical protein